MDFGLLSDEKKRYYHKISYLDLDYIYIQNFLFIEKLKMEYLDVFKERILNKNYEVDNVLLNIVDEMFQKVMKGIFDGTNETDERCIVCYGFESPSNHFYNDSLAIRIEYGRNTVELNNEDFLVNYNRKKELLDEVIKKMQDRGLKNGIIIESRVMKIM